MIPTIVAVLLPLSGIIAVIGWQVFMPSMWLTVFLTVLTVGAVTLIFGPGVWLGVHWQGMAFSFMSDYKDKNDEIETKISKENKALMNKSLFDLEKETEEDDDIRNYFVDWQEEVQLDSFGLSEGLLEEWMAILKQEHLTRADIARIRNIAMDIMVMTKFKIDAITKNIDKYTHIYKIFLKLCRDTISDNTKKKYVDNITDAMYSKLVDISLYVADFNHALDFLVSLELFASYKPPSLHNNAYFPSKTLETIFGLTIYVPAVITDVIFGIHSGFKGACDGLEKMLPVLAKSGNEIINDLYDYDNDLNIPFGKYKKSRVNGERDKGVHYWWRIRRIEARFLPFALTIRPVFMFLMGQTVLSSLFLSLSIGPILTIVLNWLPHIQTLIQNLGYKKRKREWSKLRTSLIGGQSGAEVTQNLVKQEFNSLIRFKNTEKKHLPDRIIVLCEETSDDFKGYVRNNLNMITGIRNLNIEFVPTRGYPGSASHFLLGMRYLKEEADKGKNVASQNRILFVDCNDMAISNALSQVSIENNYSQLSPIQLAVLNGIRLSYVAEQKRKGGFFFVDASKMYVGPIDINDGITIYGKRSSRNAITGRKSGIIVLDSKTKPISSISSEVSNFDEQIIKEKLKRIYDVNNQKAKQYFEPTGNMTFIFSDRYDNGSPVKTSQEQLNDFLNTTSQIGEYVKDKCGNISISMLEYFLIPLIRIARNCKECDIYSLRDINSLIDTTFAAKLTEGEDKESYKETKIIEGTKIKKLFGNYLKIFYPDLEKISEYYDDFHKMPEPAISMHCYAPPEAKYWKVSDESTVSFEDDLDIDSKKANKKMPSGVIPAAAQNAANQAVKNNGAAKDNLKGVSDKASSKVSMKLAALLSISGVFCGPKGISKLMKYSRDAADNIINREKSASNLKKKTVFMPCETIGADDLNLAEKISDKKLNAILLSFLPENASCTLKGRIIVKMNDTEILSDVYEANDAPEVFFKPSMKQCSLKAKMYSHILAEGNAEKSRALRKIFLAKATTSYMKEIALKGNPDIRDALRSLPLNHKTVNPSVVHADYSIGLLIKADIMNDIKAGETALAKTVCSIELGNNFDGQPGLLNGDESEKNLLSSFKSIDINKDKYGLKKLAIACADIVSTLEPLKSLDIPEDLRPDIDVDISALDSKAVERLVSAWKNCDKEKIEQNSGDQSGEEASISEIQESYRKGYELGKEIGAKGISSFDNLNTSIELQLAASKDNENILRTPMLHIFKNIMSKGKNDISIFYKDENWLKSSKLALQLLSKSGGDEETIENVISYIRHLNRSLQFTSSNRLKANGFAGFLGRMQALTEEMPKNLYENYIMKNTIDVGKIAEITFAA